MTDFIKYTPEEIIAEAQRVARDRFHDGVFEMTEGHITDMFDHFLPGNLELFMEVFGEELLALSRQWRSQRENDYLERNT